MRTNCNGKLFSIIQDKKEIIIYSIKNFDCIQRGKENITTLLNKIITIRRYCIYCLATSIFFNKAKLVIIKNKMKLQQNINAASTILDTTGIMFIGLQLLESADDLLASFNMGINTL